LAHSQWNEVILSFNSDHLSSLSFYLCPEDALLSEHSIFPCLFKYLFLQVLSRIIFVVVGIGDCLFQYLSRIFFGGRGIGY
jgi:hypothetical protein